MIHSGRLCCDPFITETARQARHIYFAVQHPLPYKQQIIVSLLRLPREEQLLTQPIYRLRIGILGLRIGISHRLASRCVRYGCPPVLELTDPGEELIGGKRQTPHRIYLIHEYHYQSNVFVARSSAGSPASIVAAALAQRAFAETPATRLPDRVAVPTA